MPRARKGRRLGGSAAHQRQILSNLATALFEHGQVTTTETKARALRPFAEKLITKAKKGDLASRRAVNAVVRKERVPGTPRMNNDVQHKLHTEIVEMFADRPGGYTRITKLGPRKGDNAPMAVIELVTEEYKPKAPAQAAPAKQESPAPAEEPAATEAPEATAAEEGAEAPAEEAAAESSEESAEAPAEESPEDPDKA